MCGLYVIYAVAWLIMSALQWRDLLRIQFWIGAVILLGNNVEINLYICTIVITIKSSYCVIQFSSESFKQCTILE